jgi:mannose-6-phosphate isomerase
LIRQPLKKNYKGIDSFIIYICTQGKAEIRTGSGNVAVSKGESILVPAEIPSLEIIPNGSAELLEVYIE